MQQHDKFKVFLGQPTAADPLGGLAEQVSKFAADQSVAAKSIGTEYIEGRRSLVVTLGYRDDEQSYPIQLRAVKLAGAGTEMKDLTALESQMAEASAKHSGIICHELFITESGEFYMVFMTRE